MHNKSRFLLHSILPNDLQLDRLQRQYRSAIENLEKQKAAAIRWMSRQEIRLITQCKETASERKAIAAVIRQEISSFPLLGAR